MRSYATRRHDDPRTLLLIAPGWVKTDLGRPNAALEIDEGIPRLVDIVDIVDAQRGRGGLRYLDCQGQIVAW